MSATNVKELARFSADSVIPIYTEQNFFSRADDLRLEFENVVSLQAQSDDGLTPFTYAFNPSLYRFLTSGAEQVFSNELVSNLTDSFSLWTAANLDLKHVSTPQVRLYISGCSRALARDSIDASWHYMLCLSAARRHKSAQIRVVTATVKEKRISPLISIQRLFRIELDFNQLLVIHTTCPYSIDISRLSMNPLDGWVLLDGYIW